MNRSTSSMTVTGVGVSGELLIVNGVDAVAPSGEICGEVVAVDRVVSWL